MNFSKKIDQENQMYIRDRMASTYNTAENLDSLVYVTDAEEMASDFIRELETHRRSLPIWKLTERWNAARDIKSMKRVLSRYSAIADDLFLDALFADEDDE